MCVQLLVHTLRIGTKGKSKKEEEVSEHNPMIIFFDSPYVGVA